MNKERLSYIFNQIVEKDEWRDNLSTPWVEKGCIYASDARILLCMKDSEDARKAFKDNGAKHPAASKLLTMDDASMHRETYYVRLAELEKDNEAVNLNGLLLAKKVAKTAAKVMRLFGMDAATFYGEKASVVFNIYDDEGVFALLKVMSISGADDIYKAHTQETESMSYLPGAFGDDVAGDLYYRVCIEEDNKKEEERKIANFKVYEVTLTKSVTICVRADSASEAGEIALENIDEWDFGDSDIEVDGYTETKRNNVCNDYDCYYDEDGEQSWDDELEEE